MTEPKKRSRTEAAEDGSQTWTDEERGAMKERAKELKAEARRKSSAMKMDGEQDLLAKIAEMPDSDRDMAQRIHTAIKASLPELESRTWYGMPAYAKDGKVVCFFQSAAKFKARYATFGFSEEAKLDDGDLWPTSFGLAKLTPAVEKRLIELVKQAVS